jgi:hypothetical protein
MAGKLNRSKPHTPNPRRVIAGKLNRSRRGPLSPEAIQRLREAALLGRPWAFSTGPRTPEGKAQAVKNGKLRQRQGGLSTRELKASLAGELGLLADMAKSGRLIAELLAGHGS